MTITINPLDGCIYRTWLRLMLGITTSTAAMRDADELYRRHPDAIRRVAQTLARELLPRVWPDRHMTLYRGLRLAASNLDSRALPPHPSYDVLPALSFSESLDVAAHFADPGALGMPAIPKLPPHGYIGTAQIDRDEVLFH